jgi:hypothetical protein
MCLLAGETTTIGFWAKRLLEERGSKEVQVLQNHAEGWRVLNV